MISPNQFTIMESLMEGPRWSRSFQTVKPLLNDLVEQGLIERCRPYLGRGCNMIRLTVAGCQVLEIDPTSVPTLRTEAQRVKPCKRWDIGSIRKDAPALARATCVAFLRALGNGSDIPEVVEQLATTNGVERPAIWRRLRSGGVLPQYRSAAQKRHQPYVPAAERTIPVRTLPPRVDRDPCQRCGVRADIGCGHSRSPLGMVL